MADYERLKGLVAQSMGGAKPGVAPFCFTVPRSSSGQSNNIGGPTGNASGILLIPYSGTYRIAMWGGGAGAANSITIAGASGAFVQADRYLAAGQSVSYQRGGEGNYSGGNGGDSYVILPSGEQITAGGGQGGVSSGVQALGGIATAKQGDIAINGSNGVAASTGGLPGGGNNGGAPAGTGVGGSGAPGWGGHKGGSASAGVNGGSPGAGGSCDSGSGSKGGCGDVIIYRVA